MTPGTSNAIAQFLKPFFFALLMAGVVIPIELLLKRLWPEGRVKRVLFDRTFRKRRPWLFMLYWIALVALAVAVVLWTV